MTVPHIMDRRVRLEAYLADHARKAFRPGQHDCITFASGARAAQTGVDPVAPYRGVYKTIEEGLEMARALGFADHVDFVTRGLTEIPVALAQVGDLVTVTGVDGLPAMGIVGGAHVYAVTPRGWGLLPLLAAHRAWRV